MPAFPAGNRLGSVAAMWTPYPDLDALLADWLAAVRSILGDSFVGAYIQGSFALGAGDRHSDCDWIVACTALPSGDAEAALRALHDELPTRDHPWALELEGSYADVATLRSIDGMGVPWLFNDHGTRTLAWDTHCNTAHARWILRERGIHLAGPPIATLVDPVPAGVLRDSMLVELPTVLAGIEAWAPLHVAWTQRYIVSTYCRTLYTIATDEVTSKRDALLWAMDRLDPRWRPLLEQVAADRAVGWDPEDPPRPGSLEAARAFGAYAEAIGPALAAG